MGNARRPEHKGERSVLALAAPVAFSIQTVEQEGEKGEFMRDRKSTRLNSSHGYISYAVFCLKKKKTIQESDIHTEYFRCEIHQRGDGVCAASRSRLG